MYQIFLMAEEKCSQMQKSFGIHGDFHEIRFFKEFIHLDSEVFQKRRFFFDKTFFTLRARRKEKHFL